MAVLRTAFSTILLAIKAELADFTLIDPTRVIVTIMRHDDVPHFGADQDILLRVMGERPVTDVIDGCGRVDNRRTRELEITARTRVQLDQSGQDEARLTSESLGHLALEDAIVDCLEQWWPTDDDGEALTLPFRINNLSMPERHQGKAKNSGWAMSTWSAHIEYIRNLSQTRI